MQSGDQRILNNDSQEGKADPDANVHAKTIRSASAERITIVNLCEQPVEAQATHEELPNITEWQVQLSLPRVSTKIASKATDVNNSDATNKTLSTYNLHDFLKPFFEKQKTAQNPDLYLIIFHNGLEIQGAFDFYNLKKNQIYPSCEGLYSSEVVLEGKTCLLISSTFVDFIIQQGVKSNYLPNKIVVPDNQSLNPLLTDKKFIKHAVKICTNQSKAKLSNKHYPKSNSKKEKRPRESGAQTNNNNNVHQSISHEPHEIECAENESTNQNTKKFKTLPNHSRSQLEFDKNVKYDFSKQCIELVGDSIENYDEASIIIIFFSSLIEAKLFGAHIQSHSKKSCSIEQKNLAYFLRREEKFLYFVLTDDKCLREDKPCRPFRSAEYSVKELPAQLSELLTKKVLTGTKNQNRAKCLLRHYKKNNGIENCDNSLNSTQATSAKTLTGSQHTSISSDNNKQFNANVYINSLFTPNVLSPSLEGTALLRSTLQSANPAKKTENNDKKTQNPNTSLLGASINAFLRSTNVSMTLPPALLSQQSSAESAILSDINKTEVKKNA